MASYAAAGQALLLLAFVPAYGAFAARVNRVWLISGVTLFFASHLLIFYVLGTAGVRIGIAFYLWIGIFNMVGGRAVLGVRQRPLQQRARQAAVPARRRRRLARRVRRLGPDGGRVRRRRSLPSDADLRGRAARARGPHDHGSSPREVASQVGAPPSPAPEGPPAAATTNRSASAAASSWCFRDRYLFLIAHARPRVQPREHARRLRPEHDDYAGGRAPWPGARAASTSARSSARWRAACRRWSTSARSCCRRSSCRASSSTSACAARCSSCRSIALGGYTAIALIPIFAVVQWTKILENSTDYSVQNTTRQALFLPTSREAKYKAKQAIDSFFLRTGDMLSAAVVFAGTALAFTVEAVRAAEHRCRRRLAGACVRHRARAPQARACRRARPGRLINNAQGTTVGRLKPAPTTPDVGVATPDVGAGFSRPSVSSVEPYR